MMGNRYKPIPDDLNLLPTRMNFMGGQTYFEFMNQSIRIPGKYCFGDNCPDAESYITYRYFKTRRFLNFLVRMVRDTGGEFQNSYRRYHELKIQLTHRLQKRVGRYGYYALAGNYDKVRRSVEEMNEVITGIIERLELPIRYFKERSIREFFLKLRRNCLVTGVDWWTPLGIDKDDLESLYEAFRNDVDDDAIARIGPKREWVSGSGCPMEDDMFALRGSVRFREQVAKEFADYLEFTDMSVDELLDMDKYEEWQRDSPSGNLDDFAIALADMWWCDGRESKKSQ